MKNRLPHLTMQICPRCQRPNPGEAVFCHFDGAELRPVGGVADPSRHTRLGQPFVFPSGRRCGTYDELTQACQEDWETARDLFRQGIFHRFLAGIGRMDLAQAAQDAQSQPDLDLALDAFIGMLPATARQGPRLDLEPRRLSLGRMRAGQARNLLLTVLNQGKGLLHGTLAIAPGSPWLLLGDGTANAECPLRTAREQFIALRVDTRGLPAPRTYAGKLTVITNGGIVEVPVRLDLAVHPFPRPPFQGAGSPREMAERMRRQPKPAVPLLESGEIARWFSANGWGYPVSGRTAKGVAAVQQFFEGMGLSKPPAVQLSPAAVQLTFRDRKATAVSLSLRTTAKKWVYAHAESDAPWLRVRTPSVSGPQQALLSLEADSSTLEPGRVHEGRVRITANAGQVLTLQVRAEVQRPPKVSRRLLAYTQASLAGILQWCGLKRLAAGVLARLEVTSPGACDTLLAKRVRGEEGGQFRALCIASGT